MKIILIAAIFMCCIAQAQNREPIANKTYLKYDTLFYVADKADTVFVGIDTTHLKIGVDGYHGEVLVFDIIRVDSIWRLQHTGLVIGWDKPIHKIHYYTKEGRRFICDDDIYYLTKAWLKTE